MADEENPSGKSKKMLLIGGLVVAVAILLALAVGGTLYFLDRDSSEAEAGEEPSSSGEVELNTASYYSFEGAFVTPLMSSDRRQRFLQVSLAVKGEDSQVAGAVEKHMPRIKNDLNRLFTGQDYQTLQTPEGKMQLQMNAAQVVQRIVEREGVKIDQVLITDFVLQ